MGTLLFDVRALVCSPGPAISSQRTSDACHVAGTRIEAGIRNRKFTSVRARDMQRDSLQCFLLIQRDSHRLLVDLTHTCTIHRCFSRQMTRNHSKPPTFPPNPLSLSLYTHTSAREKPRRTRKTRMIHCHRL